jgi:ATP synthase protein I
MSRNTTRMQANEPSKVENPESPNDDFLPLTAEQAAQWRQRNPVVSVWRVVFWQAGVGILLAALVGWWTGRMMVALSVLYGSAAVFIPAALFARGLTSRLTTANPMAAAAGFLVWEGVKVAMTVMVLLLAPRLVEGLSWPALLAGLIVTMKVYWLALAWRPKPLKQDPWIKS